MRAGEVAKVTFEDLDCLLAACSESGAAAALERIVHSMQRALIVPAGSTASGMREGLRRWEALRLPLRDSEEGK